MPPAFSDDEASDIELEVEASTKISSRSVSKKTTEEPSDEDDIIAIEHTNVPDGHEEDEEEDDEEDNEEEDNEAEGDEALGEDEYVIESITNHAIDEEGNLRLEVKWQGYEKKSDRTWEPEENLIETASVAVNEYLNRNGGRDFIMTSGVEAEKKTKAKKRGRPSTNSSVEPNGKKQKPHPKSTSPPASLKAAFNPPTGSWEEDVQSIDGFEGTDGKYFVYLQWKSGNRSRHPLSMVYRRCPQKMLKFYEAHLSFVPATNASESKTNIQLGSSKQAKRGRSRKQAA